MLVLESKLNAPGEEHIGLCCHFGIKDFNSAMYIQILLQKFFLFKAKPAFHRSLSKGEQTYHGRYNAFRVSLHQLLDMDWASR